MRIRRLPSFEYRAISHLSTVFHKPLLILGSGPSASDFAKLRMKPSSIGITFAVGRWFLFDLIPDILFLETSPEKLYWTDKFITALNGKAHAFTNTIILIEVFDSSFATHRYIFSNLSPILSKNLYFICSIKCSTRPALRNFYEWVHKSNFIHNVNKYLSILSHCRSAVTLGLSLSYSLGIKNVYVTGVDGYSGYLCDRSNVEFHMTGLHENSKNLDHKLHSTSNPAFGNPTVPECFIAMRELVNISVTSSSSLLSNYFPISSPTDFRI